MILIRLLVITICLLVLCKEIAANRNVSRDAKLSTPDLIAVYGYPSEIHQIITEDGYILEVHRIAAPGKQPVLLMHGLLDSSAGYLLLGPKKALGYILYDAGYDVWLANARGNTYSRHHVKYEPSGWRPDRKKFWNFSWHEIGQYDIPAMIDCITSETHYIGHSQGTTSFFVMASERPEYNEKIKFMAALAPPIFMGSVKNQFLRVIVQYLETIQTFTDLVGLYEFSDQVNKLFTIAEHSPVCYLRSLKESQICNNNFSPIIGNITDHVDRLIVPIISTHAPAGAAMRQLYHYGQLIRTDHFRQFDHGLRRNLLIYGQPTPPDYNLKNCTVPVGIFYADKDTLASAESAKRLAKELPNLVEIRRVDDESFNHVDYIWASDANDLVYDQLIKWLKSADERDDKKNQMSIKR